MHHTRHERSVPPSAGTRPQAPGRLRPQPPGVVREGPGGTLACPGCGARLRFGPEPGQTVGRPGDVAALLLAEMGGLDREELRVVLLDAKNHLLGVRTVYVGNVSAAVVRIGELFRDAVREAASAVVLAHNHPSGDPTPSPDDLHLTAEALAAGRLLDVDVLDHLVVGRDAFVSLRERGVAFGGDRERHRAPTTAADAAEARAAEQYQTGGTR